MDAEMEIVPKKVKHPSLFFPDGNIVLSIIHNNEQQLFKCHKSVLAKHSPVFAEMFELALYELESEEYDGVLVIALPDAFEDVSALLSLLYDPLKMPYKKHHPDTVQTIHGPLKLATKYQMGSLRKRFISILQADWPYDLDDWDENEAERAKATSSHYSDKLPYPYPEPARVIRLAKECCVPSLLPAAFYHLHRSYDIGISSRVEYTEAEIDLLTTDDWHSLLNGRNQMQLELASYLSNFLTERRTIDAVNVCSHSPPERPDSWGCKHSARDWWTATCFQVLPKLMLADPLEELNVLSCKADSAPSVCRHCRAWIQNYLLTRRRALWSRLKDFFQVGSDVEQVTNNLLLD